MFKYNHFTTILPRVMLRFSLAGVASGRRTQSIQPVPEAVDKISPPFPAVIEVSGRSVRPSTTGPRPEDGAVKLAKEIAGRLHELGQHAGPTRDGHRDRVFVPDRDLAFSTCNASASATGTYANFARPA